MVTAQDRNRVRGDHGLTLQNPRDDGSAELPRAGELASGCGHAGPATLSGPGLSPRAFRQIAKMLVRRANGIIRPDAHVEGIRRQPDFDFSMAVPFG